MFKSNSPPPNPVKAATLTHDFSAGSLPAGCSIARASVGSYYDVAGVLQSAAIDVARFGYDLVRADQGAALLLEPAARNWAKNGAMTGGVAASDLTTFNTTTGQNSGTWGTLPGNWGLVVPSHADGTTTGWQIAAIGTVDGEAYIDIRLEATNAAVPDPLDPTAGTKNFRVLFTLSSGAGVAASPGQQWAVSFRSKLVAGAITGASFRATLRSTNAGSFVQAIETALPDPTATEAQCVGVGTLGVSTITAMTGGLSIAIPAGVTIDVTLRVRSPQLEQAPWPGSLIPSDNTAYPTRSADTLTVPAPITAGTIYARIWTQWANYDATATAVVGAVALTLPAEAVTAGNHRVLSVELSDRPLAPDRRKLSWAPSALGTYVATTQATPSGHYYPPATAVSPKDGHVYGASAAYEADVDVVLIIPAGVKGPIKIEGGRNIRVIAGRLANEDTALDFTSTRSTVSIVGAAREIFIEGLHLALNLTVIERDAINCQGDGAGVAINTPIVIVQNCLLEGIHGRSDQTTVQPDGTVGNHSDALQAFGPIGELRMDKVTFTSSYQGVFIRAVLGMGKRTLRRISGAFQAYDPALDLAHPYPFWLGTPPDDGIADADWPQTVLHDVYITPKAGLSLGQSVWPHDAYTPSQYASEVGDDAVSVSFPAAMKVNGCVKLGPAPADVIVASTAVGLGYKTPGYGYAP